MYDSTISLTLDTICPWTYLAKKRLDEAIRQVRETDAASKVNFTVKFKPYQLYPEATQEGESKYHWYKRSRYGDSEDKMKTYITLMSAYGATAGIDFKFRGTVANTLNAHRVVQYFQATKGPEVADKLVNSLYRLYFEEEQHPSTPETLLKACEEAGIEAAEAKAFIENEDAYLKETKIAIQEQAHNDVESVPYIVFEGKRRDITLEGANEVSDYVKTLNQIVKESE